MDQDVLDLVGLLDLDAYPYAVDAGLDEDPLILVAGDDNGVQENLGRGTGLDLGDIVSFGRLRREVGETKGGCQGAANSLEIRAERLGLVWRKS